MNTQRDSKQDFESARHTMKSALHAFYDERRKLHEFLYEMGENDTSRNTDDASVAYSITFELESLQESEQELRRELDSITLDVQSHCCLEQSFDDDSSVSSYVSDLSEDSMLDDEMFFKTPYNNKSEAILPPPPPPLLIPASPFSSDFSSSNSTQSIDESTLFTHRGSHEEEEYCGLLQQDDNDVFGEEESCDSIKELLAISNNITRNKKEKDNEEKDNEQRKQETQTTDALVKKAAILLFGSSYHRTCPTVSLQVQMTCLTSCFMLACHLLKQEI